MRGWLRLAVSFSLISADRPSNAADIAYLYYLPFCMVFTSSDNLHARTAPLFMRADQHFLPGGDLKADLQRLDAHFSAQPAEVLERGVMYFEPPYHHDSYLTTRLWKRYMPRWKPGGRGKVEMPADREKKLVEEFTALAKAPTSADGPPDFDASDFVMIQRVVPVRMGKWRILPPEVEQANHRNDKARGEP